MSIIQVVLVDDHELMRQGLRAILELYSNQNENRSFERDMVE